MKQMRCRKCGNPLPNNDIFCKFCGEGMTQEQINANMQDKIKESRRIELLSEKYGLHDRIEYREEKDNRTAKYAAIILVVLFLVIIAVILFLLKQA